MTPSDPAGTGILHVTASGPADGSPVVVLHGWGSSAALMTGFVDSLSDRYRVYNVDLPGHGSAQVPVEALGMEAHAAAVAALIPSRAHLVGHSNGGRIALWMAGDPRYQGLVESLTLISPSGIRRPRSALLRARSVLARSLKAPFELLPPELREHGLDWLRHSLLWQLLGSSDYRKLSGTMRQTFVQLVNTYVEDRLNRITAPTLVFWGDADDAVLRMQIDVLIAGIADAGLVVLEGAGHYGFLDQPDIVLAGTRHLLLGLGEGVRA